MPFHPEKDLAPISTLAMIPFFLIAHPSQPATLKEVLAKAKSAPAELSYGHGGNGSTMHLSGELLNMLAGVKIQAVPYKGSGPVAADVLGGQVPLGVVDVPSTLSNVRAGKVRALAVTSKRRISAAPEVPTFEEAGVPGYEAIGWFGVVAPAGTPAPIIERLNAEIRAALNTPEIRQRALDAGTEPSTTTPQEFAAMIREETRKWAEVIKAGGIKLQ
jgi:tripartite-type tricarboxylate transporter receptor subunit TctC